MTTLLEQLEAKRCREKIVPDLIENFDKLSYIHITNTTDRDEALQDTYEGLPWFESVEEMLDNALKRECSMMRRRLTDTSIIELGIKLEMLRRRVTLVNVDKLFEDVENYRKTLEQNELLQFQILFDRGTTCRYFEGDIYPLLYLARSSGEVVMRRLTEVSIFQIHITDPTK